MKKFTLLFLLVVAFGAANAQNEIMLHLAPRLGASVFSLNQVVTHPSGSYQMKYTRFEYYISEIKITHDGGQITPVTDMHLLVRPALDSMYSLGQLPGVQNVEAITFSVGVDQAFNHLDPTSFPANDPLAPQNPAMQWGWTAGYRFAALEGDAGTNLAQHFEIHALGDGNYKTQTVITTAEQVSSDMKMIHLKADYTKALTSINVSGGLVLHGTTGAAVTLLNNFKNIVYTSETSKTVDPAFTGVFSLSSNPAINVAPQVNYSIPSGNDYELSVSDLLGKNILRQTLDAAENQSLVLDKLPQSGLFIVQLWMNGKPVAAEKLIVLK